VRWRAALAAGGAPPHDSLNAAMRGGSAAAVQQAGGQQAAVQQAAGVLLRLFDGMSDAARPWLPCVSRSDWCFPMSVRDTAGQEHSHHLPI
jgi:hypothetical protein